MTQAVFSRPSALKAVAVLQTRRSMTMETVLPLTAALASSPVRTLKPALRLSVETRFGNNTNGSITFLRNKYEFILLKAQHLKTQMLFFCFVIMIFYFCIVFCLSWHFLVSHHVYFAIEIWIWKIFFFQHMSERSMGMRNETSTGSHRRSHKYLSKKSRVFNLCPRLPGHVRKYVRCFSWRVQYYNLSRRMRL